MELTDKESHTIQNEIDQVMDTLDVCRRVTKEYIGNNTLSEVINKLEEIRDSIPCSCYTNSKRICT